MRRVVVAAVVVVVVVVVRRRKWAEDWIVCPHLYHYYYDHVLVVLGVVWLLVDTCLPPWVSTAEPWH